MYIQLRGAPLSQEVLCEEAPSVVPWYSLFSSTNFRSVVPQWWNTDLNKRQDISWNEVILLSNYEDQLSTMSHFTSLSGICFKVQMSENIKISMPAITNDDASIKNACLWLELKPIRVAKYSPEVCVLHIEKMVDSHERDWLLMKLRN